MKKRHTHKPVKTYSARKPRKLLREALLKAPQAVAPKIPAHRIALLPYTMEFHPEL